MDWKNYIYSCKWVDRFGFVEKRPLISVSLVKNGKEMSQLAMIDSGSHSIIASQEIAKFLEIDTTHSPKINVGGIVGKPIEGAIEHVELKVNEFNSTIRVPVIFVPNLQVNLLLGQRGFFENFDIKFEYQKGNFSLLSSKKGHIKKGKIKKKKSG